MRLPIVAIVGRANVGKSTLFNRIIAEPKALVSPIPGTTRDIQTAETNWRDKTFTLSDTGGLDVDHKDEIETKVRVQAEKAIAKARVIIFVVDVRDGLMPQDRVLADSLKRGKKPVIFVANKVDSTNLRAAAADREWLKLGFGAPHTVSATTGIGVGDLLDVVASHLEKPGREPVEPSVKIAMIGRPNVGKSSLLNAILGEERFITSATPHTTREPVDTPIYYTPDEQTKVPILLIDTAGIRRRARVEKGLESAGVRRSLEMVRRADVILFVLDLSDSITAQDKNLASLIKEEKKALIVIANKWDLIKEKKTKMALDKEYKNKVLRDLPFLGFAPMLFTSALEKKNIHKIIETAINVHQKMHTELSEKELLEFWGKVVRTPIPGKGVHHPHVYSFKQTSTNPPVFHVAVREKPLEPLNPAYLKFLERQLRDWYDLEGVPIQVLSKNIKKGN